MHIFSDNSSTVCAWRRNCWQLILIFSLVRLHPPLIRALLCEEGEIINFCLQFLKTIFPSSTAETAPSVSFMRFFPRLSLYSVLIKLEHIFSRTWFWFSLAEKKLRRERATNEIGRSFERCSFIGEKGFCLRMCFIDYPAEGEQKKFN